MREVRDIFGLTDGNPGALEAVMNLDYEALLFCDYNDIVGTKLYLLWNDCCQKDKVKMNKICNLGRTNDERRNYILESVNKDHSNIDIKVLKKLI